MKSLERRMLVRDTMRHQEVEIAWEQFSRCGLAYCSEKYLLADFFENGDKRFPVVKLFVAKSLGLPSRFFTGGYSSSDSMLHFGIHLPKQGGRSGDMSAIFIVIHPTPGVLINTGSLTSWAVQSLVMQAEQTENISAILAESQTFVVSYCFEVKHTVIAKYNKGPHTQRQNNKIPWKIP